VVATAKVLAKAISTIEGVDLVITGNASTDGVAGALPAILSELLGMPQVTNVRKLDIDDVLIKAVRETEEGVLHLEARLPAVVSVNEKINEPRYPSFKGIMAAKKKPVTTMTVDKLGLSLDEVGLKGAWSQVLEAAPRPARTAGKRVVDEGSAGVEITEYLVGQKLI
jgi:electron transfer flavoprotein beta subunit